MFNLLHSLLIACSLFGAVELTCLQEYGGCVYNISLQESCQLLMHSRNSEGLNSNQDFTSVLKIINDKLDNVMLSAKPCSDADLLLDSGGSLEHQIRHLKERDTSLWRSFKSLVDDKTELIQDLRTEKNTLQTALTKITDENARCKTEKVLFSDRYGECLKATEQKSAELAESLRQQRTLKHTIHKLNEEIKQQITLRQDANNQNFQSDKKFSALLTFANKLFELQLKERTLNPDHSAEAWEINLKMLYEKICAELSGNLLNKKYMDELQRKNAVLNAYVSQKDSHFEEKRKCERNITLLNSRNTQLMLRVKELEGAAQNQTNRNALMAQASRSTCITVIKSSSCNMEDLEPGKESMCWFERIETSDFNWRIRSNKDLLQTQYKELRDHTCENHHGRFIYLDLARLVAGQQARLTSVFISEKDSPQCFSFWYRIYYVFNQGKFYATVTMYDDEESNKVPETIKVWQQYLGRPNEWQFAKFGIPQHITRQGYKIQFVAEANGPGYIALDDLSLSKESCY